jgi:hypothetical protein
MQSNCSHTHAACDRRPTQTRDLVVTLWGDCHANANANANGGLPASLHFSDGRGQKNPPAPLTCLGWVVVWLCVRGTSESIAEPGT